MSEDMPQCYHCGRPIDTLRQSYGEKIIENGVRVFVHLYPCVVAKNQEAKESKERD